MAIELADTSASRGMTATKAPFTQKPRAGRRIKAQDRMFFTERLALLLETGMSLHAGLEVIEGQLESPAFAAVVARLRQEIAAGASFSQALARHPQVFTGSYVNLIGASEQGGFMADVLKQLMVMEEKQAQLRATLVSSMSYPIFLIVFSIAVVIFVLTVIFPKFADLFSSIADQLPITTLLLMAMSDFLRQYWIPLLGLLAVLIILARQWMKSPGGRGTIDRLKLKLPVVGGIYAQLYLAQLMRVMGLSLHYGVNVPDTLRASHDVVSNLVFQEMLSRIETQIQEGCGIGKGFQEAEFVPSLVKQMITTGDETGKLPLVMSRIADFYQQEMTRKVERLSKMVEPVMLLLMGVVVGTIVSSLILPIFKLSRTVQ